MEGGKKCLCVVFLFFGFFVVVFADQKIASS